MTWLHDRLTWLTAPWLALSDMQTQITRLQMQMLDLRSRMAATDDLAARLNAATDDLANDLQQLRDEVAALDAGVAAKFEPLVSRLEAMGADPENPVPDAPAEGGEEPPADQPA